jgi:hypothetical protein
MTSSTPARFGPHRRIFSRQKRIFFFPNKGEVERCFPHSRSIEESREMSSPPPHPPPLLPPPPTLTDDLISDEIFLRLPPDNPASLVRASIVCKSWRRLLSNPNFFSGYCAFHRAPPLLGFLHNQYDYDDDSHIPKFVHIMATPPISLPLLDDLNYSWALDCRHGRVLIYDAEPSILIVCDPITGDCKHVPMPDYPYEGFNAAVLCAVDGCNHLKCSGGIFHLVLKATDIDDNDVSWVAVYSSKTGMWSVPVSIHIKPVLNPFSIVQRSLVMGDVVYFPHVYGQSVLKYDMGKHVLSVMTLPQLYKENMVLVAAEDDKLGIAGLDGYYLRLWWLQDIDGDLAEWVPGRVIELDTMISITIGDPSSKLRVVSYAESASVVFISGHAGSFIVETKSGKVRKLHERRDFEDIFPYESFYNPLWY